MAAPKLRENPGSTAGASSTTFHRYRIDKRIEQERLDAVERKQKEAAQDKEWTEKKMSEAQRLEAAAERRRAKRMRRKLRQKAASIVAKEEKLELGPATGAGSSCGPSLPASAIAGSKRPRSEGDTGKQEEVESYDFLLSSDTKPSSSSSSSSASAGEASTSTPDRVAASTAAAACEEPPHKKARAEDGAGAEGLTAEGLEQVDLLVETGVPREEAVAMVREMVAQPETEDGLPASATGDEAKEALGT